MGGGVTVAASGGAVKKRGGDPHGARRWVRCPRWRGRDRVAGLMLAPHPTLPEYYESEATKRAFVRGIFDETAGDYDRVERVMALGTGPWYRRQALKRAGLVGGMKVLDVATGTGLVAREEVA